jgi:2',3'-cyclic-nucleotide 2'-phosphodiesterase (5'-nucleotidase family)
LTADEMNEAQKVEKRLVEALEAAANAARVAEDVADWLRSRVGDITEIAARDRAELAIQELAEMGEEIRAAALRAAPFAGEGRPFRISDLGRV